MRCWTILMVVRWRRWRRPTGSGRSGSATLVAVSAAACGTGTRGGSRAARAVQENLIQSIRCRAGHALHHYAAIDYRFRNRLVLEYLDRFTRFEHAALARLQQMINL